LKKYYTLLSILAAAFILWVIYLANAGATSVFFSFIQHIPFGDKLGHFGLFGSLTLLVLAATNGKSVGVSGQRWYIGSLIILLFVTAEEISQLYIPSRTFDVFDWLADVAGILGASLVYKLALHMRTNRTL